MHQQRSPLPAPPARERPTPESRSAEWLSRGPSALENFPRIFSPLFPVLARLPLRSNLRHTGATWALQECVSPVLVAFRLGHRSTWMIEQHYGRLIADRLEGSRSDADQMRTKAGRRRVRAEGVPPDLRFRGADDGIRTRDPHLGKVVLYQLSHVRVLAILSVVALGWWCLSLASARRRGPARSERPRPRRARREQPLAMRTPMFPTRPDSPRCS